MNHDANQWSEIWKTTSKCSRKTEKIKESKLLYQPKWIVMMARFTDPPILAVSRGDFQPTFQRCGSTLKQRWSDVENETKSDVGFSTLHNVDITSGPDVETTLKQRYTTSKQRCTALIKR